MNCRTKNRLFGVVLATAIICTLLSAANGFAKPRLDLKAGETNWVEPVYPAGEKAVITIQDLNAITTQQMVETLLNTTFPDAILAVQNIVFTGDNRAGGTFANAFWPIGLDHGAIVSSGRIASVIGGAAPGFNTSQSTSTAWGLAGDPLITAISGFPTFDAAKLTFQIKSTIEQLIVFHYVFGSECYDEWVGTQYNDGFRIRIDGIDVALIPPFLGALPVTINNVNNGNPWYLTNVASVRETELDGLTQNPAAPIGGPGIPVTSLPFLMTADVWHDVEIVIADASDMVWDSDAFIKAYFGPAAQTGACTLTSGLCTITSAAYCDSAGGSYAGDGTSCGATGACCLNEGCIETTQSNCQVLGGSYQGDGSDCVLGACVVGGQCYISTQECCPGSWQGPGSACEVAEELHEIPTLSQWGLLVLLLLLAGSAIIMIRRQKRATAR